MNTKTICGLCRKLFTREEIDGERYVHSWHTDTFYHIYGDGACDRTSTVQSESNDPSVTKPKYKTL